MTTMPHDHPPFDAVDKLFETRAQIKALRDREAELCDEIRTFATENDAQSVIGATRVAVIESRRPTRVDPTRLPTAILNDPNFFVQNEETLVLLAPISAAQSQGATGATAAPLAQAEQAHAESAQAAPTMPEPAMPDPTMPEPTMPETIATAAVEAVEAVEAAGDAAEITDPGADPSIPVPDFSEDPETDMADEFEGEFEDAFEGGIDSDAQIQVETGAEALPEAPEMGADLMGTDPELAEDISAPVAAEDFATEDLATTADGLDGGFAAPLTDRLSDMPTETPTASVADDLAAALPEFDDTAAYDAMAEVEAEAVVEAGPVAEDLAATPPAGFDDIASEPPEPLDMPSADLSATDIAAPALDPVSPAPLASGTESPAAAMPERDLTDMADDLADDLAQEDAAPDMVADMTAPASAPDIAPTEVDLALPQSDAPQADMSDDLAMEAPSPLPGTSDPDPRAERPSAPVKMRTIGMPLEQADPLATDLDLADEAAIAPQADLSEPVMEVAPPAEAETAPEMALDPDIPDMPAGDPAPAPEVGSAPDLADIAQDTPTEAAPDMALPLPDFGSDISGAAPASAAQLPEFADEMDMDAPDGSAAGDASDEMVEGDALTPLGLTEVPEEFVSASDPFDLNTTPVQEASPDLPPVATEGWAQSETPRDLRPTEHADLQPLAGLQDEDLAQVLADADEPVEAVTLPDALDLAQTLEAEADKKFAEDPDGMAIDAQASAFTSRRVAAGGDS